LKCRPPSNVGTSTPKRYDIKYYKRVMFPNMQTQINCFDAAVRLEVVSQIRSSKYGNKHLLLWTAYDSHVVMFSEILITSRYSFVLKWPFCSSL
jgi:hypothetical protein